MHDANSFVTLTLDDAHLPSDLSLDKSLFPEFIRKLRKRRGSRTVRYYHVGEYGEQLGRPHYHALLFGEDFADTRVPVRKAGSHPMWISDELLELWPLGLHTIGSVTFESAAYCARYVCKKVTGSRAEEHYGGRTPEYATMSRRPGIGAGWLERYRSDVYPSDEVVVRGAVCRPPRFYDSRLSEVEMAAVKSRRLESGFESLADRSAVRLQVREVCAEARLTLHSENGL